MFFFKHHEDKKAGRLVPGLFSLFEKALYEAEASGRHPSFNTF